MLDLIIFIFVITGATYLIRFIVTFLLQSLFGGKPKNLVNQIYKDHPEVNLEKVKYFISDELQPEEIYSHWEMVAIFTTFLLKENVQEVLKRSQVYGDLGWEKKFNYDFYNEIDQTANKIYLRKSKKIAEKLLMFGKRLAERYDQREWAEKYWLLYKKIHEEQNTLKWDLRRRLR
ncbi:MAG: hypothetical protein CL609_03880 [Anaerolineaceae bacterium]|nr:hypothetical protein [Anaerolineaceae bacterium]